MRLRVRCPKSYHETRNVFTVTLNVNNSVIFQLRTLPKVANERYCNVFLIFGVVWGKGVATQGVLKKFLDNENRRKTTFFTSNSKAKKGAKKLATFFFGQKSSCSDC